MMPTGTWLTRPIRICIMCSLILAFFVLSPLIILYTAGYRYDVSSRRILQTGVLSVDITPRDSHVTLNGIVINKRIPIRLTNRAPGTYTLGLHRDGYYSWEHIIDIKSNQTTYIRDLRLFPINLPIRSELALTHTTNTTYVANPQYPYIITYTKRDGVQDIGLIRTTEQTHSSIIRTAGESVHRIVWSPYAPIALVSIQTLEGFDIYLIDAATQNLNDPLFVPHEPTFLWSNTDTQELLVTNGQDTYSIQLGTPPIEVSPATVPEGVARRVSVSDEQWYDMSYVSDMTIVSNPQAHSAISIPAVFDDIITVRGNTLVGATGDTLFLVYLDRGTGMGQVYETIETAKWFALKDDIIIWSPWSIFAIRSDGKSDLLYRTSNPLIGAEMLTPDTAEMLLTTQSTLVVFDPRFNHVTPLLTATDIQTASVNIEAATILFHGTVGNRTGFFTLDF